MSDLYISKTLAESDLLAAAAYIGERIRSSDGHAEAMNAILPIYLARGEVDLAAELANAVDDPYSRDRLLTQVAEKCAEIDDDDYAIQLAEAIEDHGQQSQALERVALALAAKGHFEKALNIAETMADPDFVFAGVAANQAADGDLAAAKTTLEDIDFPSAKVSAIQHIAANLISAGNADDAVEWLDAGVEAAHDVEHDEEKIRAINEIAAQYADAKRNDKAVETYDLARSLAEQLDSGMRDFFIGTTALGFLIVGGTDLAEQSLDLITDKTQMASALVGFARESWKKDEKDEAIDTLEEASAILKSQREIEIRDSKSRNRLLTVMAGQYAGFGKTERGVELAHENPDPAEETDALSQIAQVLVAQKEDAVARQTINEIREDSDRMFALVELADAKLNAGDSEGSHELLVEALTMADSVPQLGARCNALNQVAVRMVHHGDIAQARSICTTCLDVIADILDESAQAAALAALSEVFAHSEMELSADDRKMIDLLIRDRDR